MENPPKPTPHDELALRVDNIKPFENIALAFSGGGFRAASFGLGVLSYLNKLNFDAPGDPLNGKTLLQQVTYMSSASGGTITTSLYALYNAQGKSFQDFYVKLFDSLGGESLLENALEILSDKKRWKNRPGKSRNMINAFAMAYDEYIFDGATLKSILYTSYKGHLQEVCFNTTEFYTGLSFRQDIKMVPDPYLDEYYKYGNENMFLDHLRAPEIRIGDVLAASSCFPGGFEPILFPEDFAVDNLDNLKGLLTLNPQTGCKVEQHFREEKKVGFMDGGVADNQGLQSMMYADGRRIRRETSFTPFDLMMVNDVDSYFLEPFVNPQKPKPGGISLTGLYVLTVLFFLIAGAIATYGIYACCPWVSLIGGTLVIIPGIFLLIIWWLRTMIKRGGKKSGFITSLRKSFTEKIIKLLIAYFTKTPVGVIKEMLEARLDSVLMLTMSVFMKRIRQLIYNRFYGSPEWKNRGKGNHIYDLAYSNDIYVAQNPPPSTFMQPTPALQKVAQTAFEMGTTLWFEKDPNQKPDYRACIIACGEFTTCYNLLGYIEKLPSSAYDPIYAPRLARLKEQLKADYARFKTDPFFQYNQDGENYKIEFFEKRDADDMPAPLC